MKKFELEKMKALKVSSQARAQKILGRAAPVAPEVLDKREQRKRDTAAGLVPFACKLPGPLSERVHALAAQHEGGLGELVAELLTKALPEDKAASKETPASEPAAKKPAAKKKSA